MCMEDVRIGRATTTQTVMVTVSDTAWTLVAPQSVDRYSLLFAPAGGDGWLFWCGVTAPPTVNPLWTGAANALHLFDLTHHGDLVRQAWYALSPSGASQLFVTDTNLRAQ